MNKILYKDNKFELAIDNIGLYLCFNGKRYELSSHSYEPCTYIKTSDGSVDIVMHGAFDFGQMISNSGEWICNSINPLQCCEVIKKEILKDRAYKKQQIVGETGYKTTCNSNRISKLKSVTCPCCKKTIWFDDTNILNGEKYEIPCDNCNTVIIRKNNCEFHYH